MQAACLIFPENAEAQLAVHLSIKGDDREEATYAP